MHFPFCSDLTQNITVCAHYNILSLYLSLVFTPVFFFMSVQETLSCSIFLLIVQMAAYYICKPLECLLSETLDKMSASPSVFLRTLLYRVDSFAM